MIAGSALYAGRVVHARSRPRRHKLSYACFWMLIDLDNLELDARRSRWFSVNRRNLLSLFDADHGDGSGRSMREQVVETLSRAGIDLAGGRIHLLTMPRILGYGFNPLSVYFCSDAAGDLVAVVYEVHNTFAERHSYLVPVLPDQMTHGELVQRCDKSFYVSPFMDMQLGYTFKVVPPGERVRVAIEVTGPEGLVLTASLAGERRPLTDAHLLGLFFSHPMLTAKVIGAIHWEALKMWLKGFHLVPRPAPPKQPVTIATPHAASRMPSHGP